MTDEQAALLASCRRAIALAPNNIAVLKTIQAESATLAPAIARGELTQDMLIDAIYESVEGSDLIESTGQAVNLAIKTGLTRGWANGHSLPAPSALGVFDFGTYSDPIPPREWIYGNIFCRKFGSSLFGDGGIGKTAVRYVQYVSIALGKELIKGEHVFRRCRVLIVSLEDDKTEMLRRLTAIIKYYGIDRSELSGWLYACAPRRAAGRLIVLDDYGNPIKDRLAEAIEAEIVGHKIDLVGIDPYVKTHALNENSNAQMDEVAGVLTDLADKHNIAFDVPHHTAKGAAEPGNADKGRGASATKDALRLVYTLNPMSADEAASLGVSEEVRRSIVRMDSGKVNIAPKATEAKWFRLVSVSLENGTEDYPHGDSIQVAERWNPPGIFDGLDEDTLNTILDDISKGLPDGRLYSLHNRSGDRWVWNAIVAVAPEVSESRAKAIMDKWVKSGLLFEEEYYDEEKRKMRKGVMVENSKRPGFAP